MNARSASREIALLTLFQLDKQGNTLLERPDFEELLTASLRTIVEEAKESFLDTANVLRAVSTDIMNHEVDHEDNAETDIDAAVKPVPLPNSREFLHQLDACLEGIEWLFESLRIPELQLLSKDPEVQDYAFYLAKLVEEHHVQLDEELDQYTDSWRVQRLAKMDAFILRLALVEIKHVEEVDTSVSINEAVELAKQFSTEESYKLINGVLGSIAKAYESKVATGA